MRLRSVAIVLLMASLMARGIAWCQSLDGLEAEIQGKQPDEVRELMVRRLGPPARILGSGFRIEEWDVDAGILTFHPAVGPSFEKGGKRVWLMHTVNPAGLCLYGHYQMTANPEPPYGMKYYLGDLYVAWDSSYIFSFHPARTEDRKSQADNFFVLHRRGRVEVKYASGVTVETRLEDVPDGALIATLTFVARPPRSVMVYRILADHTGRMLRFAGEPMPFELDKGWVNYWR